MRINLGIRRRLAPLLDNDRREIELINGAAVLAARQPGHLLRRRDRHGRQHLPRRPRRRAHADAVDARPQRRVLAGRLAAAVPAAVIDPVYGYEAVNVEAQHRTPTLVAVVDAAPDRSSASSIPVFGAAPSRCFGPENRRCLGVTSAASRRSVVLWWTTSPRSPQSARARPVALRGPGAGGAVRRHRFPRIGELPYLLTLGRSFYWFRAEVGPRPSIALDSAPRPLIEFDCALPYLQSERWYGAHSREVQAACVRRDPCRSTTPARCAWRSSTWCSTPGPTTVYQLLVREDDGEVFEATGDPLVGYAGGSSPPRRVRVVDGHRRAHHVRCDPSGHTARLPGGAVPSGWKRRTPSSWSTTCSSKTYRHVASGRERRARHAAVLRRARFRPCPRARGLVRGPRAARAGDPRAAAALRTRCDRRVGAGAQRELAVRPPTRSSAGSSSSARSWARCTRCWRPTGSDPSFAPEDPTPESAGLVSARIDEEIDATFDELGDREELAPLIGRTESGARTGCWPAQRRAPRGAPSVTHGDLHLGQALWHTTVDPAGDWMVIDFEGEPTRRSPARRHKAAPLRDVAGMLRSLSYLASAVRRDGIEIPDEWERDARSSFLDGYRASPAVAVLPSSIDAQDQQLDDVRARKGVLRAALRAGSPPRLGRHPRRQHRRPPRRRGV